MMVITMKTVVVCLLLQEPNNPGQPVRQFKQEQPATAPSPHLPKQEPHQQPKSDSPPDPQEGCHNADPPQQQAGPTVTFSAAGDAVMTEASAASPSSQQTGNQNAAAQATPVSSYEHKKPAAPLVSPQPTAARQTEDSALLSGSEPPSPGGTQPLSPGGMHNPSQGGTQNASAPYLTLHLQWRLCHTSPSADDGVHEQPDSTVDPLQSQPVSGQAGNPYQLQLGFGQAVGRAASLPHQGSVARAVGQPSRAVGQPSRAVGQGSGDFTAADAGRADNQCKTQLKCCLSAEPAIPVEVLECFQDMLGEWQNHYSVFGTFRYTLNFTFFNCGMNAFAL